MKNKKINKRKQKDKKRSPIFLIALFNFLIIILIAIYFIYLRFIPYMTLTYDGYAVSGKKLVSNLLNTTFEVDESMDALEVKDQDEIYKNLMSYYVGTNKEKDINLNYPIYINDTLALYNLSSDAKLITDQLQTVDGYKGFTLTSGALYNSNTLERADYYNYVLMKTPDNVYINSKEIKIKTNLNEYIIKMNSIINFTDEFITYYTLKDGKFIYGKILDIDRSSIITIEEYDKKYTYEDFLMGLNIIRPNITTDKPEEENQKDENTTKEKDKPVRENTIVEENPIVQENVVEQNTAEENITPEKPTDEVPEENNAEPPKPGQWQKPSVSCTDFIPSTYTATTQISISDPSGVISKAITFTFYKDKEIAFRVSATASGSLKVSKLMPNTTYNVIGTYQYENETGGIIEARFLDQEFKTQDTKNIKPIDLSFKNGAIYFDKIEVLDLKIASDIKDEAISGISRAEIKINGTVYPISSSTVRSLIKGETTQNYTFEGLNSNTKYNYEIRFYDTANNEMKLTNNTGSTVTSKAEPSVKVTVKNEDVVSIIVNLNLNNPDKVELNNYRYEIYSNDTGKLYKKDKLEINERNLQLQDLNLQETYNIKIYADYDIEDGKGIQKDKQIGSATFTTSSLNKLGVLKLQLSYDEKDLTYNSFKFNTSIKTDGTNGTDQRLIKILHNVNIEIQDENGQVISTNVLNDINALVADGVYTNIENLRSNKTYNIVITATVLQGNKEEEIRTSYTLRTFTTNKKPAEMFIKNKVVTKNLIDFDVLVYDPDETSLDKKAIIDLIDTENNDTVIESKTIDVSVDTNNYTRCTFTELTPNKVYRIDCYAKKYNETNDSKKIQNNFIIGSIDLKTSGLEGNIDLNGLLKKNKGKNLIDVESDNNWYSQCFDVMTTQYTTPDNSNSFRITSTKSYGKTYDKSTKTLTLKGSQCYLYDFSDYKGKQVTISFTLPSQPTAQMFLQVGKDLDETNRTNLSELKDKNGSNKYTKTVTIPDDGYLGFDIESNSDLRIQNLQVVEGTEETEIAEYEYDLTAEINTEFIDKNYITFDGDINDENKHTKFYIRFIHNDIVEEHSYESETNTYKKVDSYKITEPEENTLYKVELYIKAYEREYVLDSLTFTYDPATCKEIKGISNLKDFLEIQPYGDYILLNDIDLKNAPTISSYTFGNDNIQFYGSIDFNGKAISNYTYSNTLSRETTSYIFYKLAEGAVLKNLVLDLNINSSTNRYDINALDGVYGLFLHNSATIDNIIINLEECKYADRRYVGLMGYENTDKGVIENFVINLRKTLYATQDISGVCWQSKGKIQNGYMYGEGGIEAGSYLGESQERNIGAIVYKLQTNGVIQNIYNISTIKINHYAKSNSFAANIAYYVEANSTIRNVYSTSAFDVIDESVTYEKLLDKNKKEINNGPNIYTYRNTPTVQSSYYFCGVNFEDNNYNTKQDITVLNDYNFQDSLLNANDYSQFITEKYVKNHYYPHLALNECMPLQDNNKIESPEDNNAMDVLSSHIIDTDSKEYKQLNENVKSQLTDYDLNDDNVQLAVFSIYNLSGRTITNIGIDYLQTTVLYQTYNKSTSTVYAILNNPTTYINEYNISSVSGKNLVGNVKEVRFGDGGDLGKRTITATFIKHIKNTDEWNSIGNKDENDVSGLKQNYKLDNDLDFSNETFVSILNNNGEIGFTGWIDGQNYTLRNINAGTNSLIDTVFGKIENLNIDGYQQNTTSNRVGLIKTVKNGAIIDNVHVKYKENDELFTNYVGGDTYIGGICAVAENQNGYPNPIEIKNCSVSNLKIDLTSRISGGANNNRIIGGIVGLVSTNNKVNIINCFSQGLNINTQSVGVTNIGGIVGRNNTVNCNVEYCYTQGNITTDKTGIGGIYGYSNGYTKHCYSLVNIINKYTSNSDDSLYIGGIGGQCTNVNYTQYNMFLGNTYITKNTARDSNRIVGNQTNSSNQHNYAYNEQIINGKKSGDKLGATELLSVDEIFTEDTYISKLQFGENNTNYSYDELEEKILPKLCNNSTGKLLPNQEDNTIANELKVISVSSEYINKEKDEKPKGTEETQNSNEVGAKITIEVERGSETQEITGFEIEYMDVEESSSWTKTNNSDDSLRTTITFKAYPKACYDTYKLTKIKYKNSEGDTTEKTLNTQIQISTRFYRIIENIEDWNKIYTYDKNEAVQEGYYPAENYRLKNDLNFTENSDANSQGIHSNVSIGRLEGFEKDASDEERGKLKMISNINLNLAKANSGFIREITANIENIKFDNITIDVNANASNTGLIYQMSASMNNCEFSNIKINVKDEDNSPKTNNIDSVGIISRATAGTNISNIKMTDIKVAGRSYVGGLVGYALSTGALKNITGDKIIINSTGSYVGGIIGYGASTGEFDSIKVTNTQVTSTVDSIGGIAGYKTGGTLKEIKAYQYDESSGDVEAQPANTTDHLVKGRSYVGGCVGQTNVSANDMETTYSKIIGTGVSVGGCVGYLSGGTSSGIKSSHNEIQGSGNSVGGCVGDMRGSCNENGITSEYNTISASETGSSNVGGCIGYCTGATITNIKSSEITEIKGKDYVGGVIGRYDNYNYGVITNIASENNKKINGSGNYVGGCVGMLAGRIKQAKTSEGVISGQQYVGGIVGQGTYNVVNTGITYYSIDGAYTINSKISGNNYVGGISGEQRGTIYAGAVDDCHITSTGDNAGGIIGLYTGSTENNNASKVACRNFYLMHSFCTNSTIQGTQNVGGLIGTFVYGNIQYCYVGKTSITATESNAGGLVGYLKNNDMTEKQYIAEMRYNFIANIAGSDHISKTVGSNTNVGGLIGTIDRIIAKITTKETTIYNDLLSKYMQYNLVVTDLVGSGNMSDISMDIGHINTEITDPEITQQPKMSNIYVYDCSRINNQLIGEQEEKYTLITSVDLFKEETFTNVDKLNFADSNSRYTYENGKFPKLNILDTTTTATYWGENDLNVQQEDILIPNETRTDILADDESKIMTFSMLQSKINVLPEMYVYTVDIDKINIEFNQTNPDAYFEVSAGDDIIISKKAIEDRVYTLSYDFNTPLTIKVLNAKNWYEEQINAQDVQNKLDIVGDEYIYIDNDKLHSNKRDIEGEFVNLYKEKALTIDGDIYNIANAKLKENKKIKIKLLDEKVPITKATYEEISLETFYHSSKVEKNETDYSYKDEQIFIKNNNIYVIDGDIDSIGNSIIIDSYNNKQYETILGDDGKLYDLLTEIKYPQNFENKDIIAMTNNIDNNNNIILVYYSTGRVYGFNYITGEEVYDNNVGKDVNILSYFMSKLSFGNLLYNVNKSSYKEAQNLAKKLDNVSVDEAIYEISTSDESKQVDDVNVQQNTSDSNNTDGKTSSSTTSEDTYTSTSSNTSNPKYITTYDSKTQTHIVYSTDELFGTDTEETESENEKINKDNKLISYYTNMSTSKRSFKSIGVIIFFVIVGLICLVWLILGINYRKNSKNK